jgi:hypothetical protein
MKNILRKLASRAETEKDFIAFYEMGMEDATVCHLPKDRREAFAGLLKVLRDDSHRHYGLVKGIIHKYDQAKLFAD